MFVFCTFEANSIFACGANWGLLLIQYTICDSTELEKMGSWVIVTEMLYCLESFVHGHHICKLVWITGGVGEKLPVDIE